MKIIVIFLIATTCFSQQVFQQNNREYSTKIDYITNNVIIANTDKISWSYSFAYELSYNLAVLESSYKIEPVKFSNIIYVFRLKNKTNSLILPYPWFTNYMKLNRSSKITEITKLATNIK